MKLRGDDLKLYKEALETIKSFSMVIQPKGYSREESRNIKRLEWYKSANAQVIDEVFYFNEPFEDQLMKAFASAYEIDETENREDFLKHFDRHFLVLKRKLTERFGKKSVDSDSNSKVGRPPLHDKELTKKYAVKAREELKGTGYSQGELNRKVEEYYLKGGIEPPSLRTIGRHING